MALNIEGRHETEIGTLQWHPARPLSPKLVVTLRPLHPAMAPWCHVQSAKVVRRPPPLLEVRTPIAIAIWGKIQTINLDIFVKFWENICYLLALPPLPATITTRMTCFVGIPYKPSLATVTWWGVDPSYLYLFGKKRFFFLALPEDDCMICPG